MKSEMNPVTTTGLIYDVFPYQILMQSCSSSLPIGIVPKINKNICTASILLFFIEQNYCVSASNVFFSLSFTMYNLRTLKEAWFVQLPPQEFVRTPCCFLWLKGSSMAAGYTSGITFIWSFVKVGELIQTSKWGDLQAELRANSDSSIRRRAFRLIEWAQLTWLMRTLRVCRRFCYP